MVRSELLIQYKENPQAPLDARGLMLLGCLRLCRDWDIYFHHRLAGGIARTSFKNKLVTIDGKNPIRKQKRRITEATDNHDIGKYELDPVLYWKEEELTPQEKTIIDNHRVVGQQILSQQGYSEEVTILVGNHHPGLTDVLTKIEVEESGVVVFSDLLGAGAADRGYRKAIDREKIGLMIAAEAANHNKAILEGIHQQELIDRVYDYRNNGGLLFSTAIVCWASQLRGAWEREYSQPNSTTLVFAAD